VVSSLGAFFLATKVSPCFHLAKACMLGSTVSVGAEYWSVVQRFLGSTTTTEGGVVASMRSSANAARTGAFCYHP
jgi:hypothetical protein